MKQLKDMVVVITGASSGVGKAMALEFASHGTKLVLAARRKEALDELVAECKAAGSTAEGIATDVRVSQDVQVLAKAAFEFGGAIAWRPAGSLPNDGKVIEDARRYS